MMTESTLIDGKVIQSERLRELRVHRNQFKDIEIFIFVPEPNVSRAQEAYMSARTKQHAFETAGFRCSICRVGEEEAIRAQKLIRVGKSYFIVQRPLYVAEFAASGEFAALDLDTGASGPWNASAISDTVQRIVSPFIGFCQKDDPSKIVQIGILGSKGFVGSQIIEHLSLCGVEIKGVDLDDDLSVIAKTQILVSAVGKRGVVTRDKLGIKKDLLVDVGYSYDEASALAYGDFDFSCYDHCAFYTPVPGGVGPLQALTLVERAAYCAGFRSYRPWAICSV